MKQQALLACQGALFNSKAKVNTLLLQLCRGFEVQMEEVIQKPCYPEVKLHTVCSTLLQVQPSNHLSLCLTGCPNAVQIVQGYQKFMAYLTARLTDSDLFDASNDEHIQKFLVSGLARCALMMQIKPVHAVPYCAMLTTHWYCHAQVMSKLCLISLCCAAELAAH
jgi:hypothetical protein